MQDISDTSISAGRYAKEASEQFPWCSAAPTTGLTRQREPMLSAQAEIFCAVKELASRQPCWQQPGPLPRGRY